MQQLREPNSRELARVFANRDRSGQELTVDVPVPPNVVLVEPAPCPDARAAEELLKRTLAPSGAPHAEWTVSVGVKQEGKELTAEAEITDDSGAPVAHRAITWETRECSSIVRAVGLWAALVLDEEVTRASAPPEAPSGPPPPPAPRPAPAPAAKPAPEQAPSQKNPEDRRDIELGAGVNYAYGVLGDGASAIAGTHVYGVFETESGWFLRPALMLGGALRDVSPAKEIDAWWGAARLDACRRVPGNYVERRGLQMDLCAGLEGGMIVLATGETCPLLAPGASLAFRGELVGELAVELRGMVGVNVLRQTILDASNDANKPMLVFTRADLGLSWRFR
jgi:hypothetical protein